MASFYIPMALSLSANLAHLPPIHGLYAFAIQPLVRPWLLSAGAAIDSLGLWSSGIVSDYGCWP